MSINDLQRTALEAQGYSGAVPDMLNDFWNTLAGTSDIQTDDARKTYFTTQGHTGGVNEQLEQFLAGLGYDTGDLHADYQAWWAAGAAVYETLVVEQLYSTDAGHDDGVSFSPATGGGVYLGPFIGYTFTGCIHFRDLVIPKDANIVSAELFWGSNQSLLLTGMWDWQAEKTTAAAPPSSSNFPSNISSLTLAAVAADSSTTAGTKTNDITTIIQELVEQPLWSGTESINIVATPTTPPPPDWLINIGTRYSGPIPKVTIVWTP